MERRMCKLRQTIHLDMDTIVTFVKKGEKVSEGGAISVLHHVKSVGYVMYS